MTTKRKSQKLLEEPLIVELSRQSLSPQLQSSPEGDIDHLLPNTTIVTHCIYKNNPYRLARCFQDQNDPYRMEVQSLINQRDAYGKSPLDIAAGLGRVELTQSLLTNGANISSTTQKGYSCLHHAAAWNHLPVLKILIEAGGNFQKVTAHGERPRDIADRYNSIECVEYLDWVEAKLKLRQNIQNAMAAVNESDKIIAGRISKEEKAMVISACKDKEEWLDTVTEPTTLDFIICCSSLTNAIADVMEKLSEPNPVPEATALGKSSLATTPKIMSSSHLSSHNTVKSSSSKLGGNSPQFQRSQSKDL